MHIDLQRGIARAVGKEIIQKALTEYFEQRGYKPLSILVYPPHIKDIAQNIPAVNGKLELIPSPDSIDPTTGVAKLRWDLFVLGTNRMCLGQTTHTSLSELTGSAGTPNINRSRLEHTARETIDFIMDILEHSEEGLDIPPPPSNNQPFVPTNRPKIGPTQSGGYYERNRLV